MSDDGMYKMSTSHGTLKQKYTRTEIIPAKSSFLEVDAVPRNEVSLREIARKDSMGGGGGGGGAVDKVIIVALALMGVTRKSVVAREQTIYATANVITLKVARTNE